MKRIRKKNIIVSIIMLILIILEIISIGRSRANKNITINLKTVDYNGEKWSLSALASKLSNSKWQVAGPRYFKYKGEWLNDIRKRLENS